MKYFVLILICAAINSLDDTNEEYRKHYGLSFHRNCGNYIITFKCLTACKSMGFQVFRLDYKCKCSCHELKTTTILPAFVWRTNGTTKKVPETFSPKLYAVVGTLSPSPVEKNEFDTTAAPIFSGCPNISNTEVSSLNFTAKPTDGTSNSSTIPANGTESTSNSTATVTEETKAVTTYTTTEAFG